MHGFAREQACYDAMSPDEGNSFDEDGKIDAKIRKDLHIVLREERGLWSWDLMDGTDQIDGNDECDSCQEAAGDAQRELEKWVAVQLENAAEDAMNQGGDE